MSTDAELAPESDPEAPAAGAAPETADAVEAAPDAVEEPAAEAPAPAEPPKPNKSGRVFTDAERAVRKQRVERAKDALDTRPFGTQYDVYSEHYEWMHHSMAPKCLDGTQFRVAADHSRLRR